ncbi:hypothetical protein C0992_008598, partial [Termitomyces sp. T32_za158]
MDELLELDMLPPFHAEDWIACGKTFLAKELPLSVLLAKQELLDILTKHLTHFPSPNVNISDFTKISFPPYFKTEIILTKPKGWFSYDMPQTDLECLTSRPIPPNEFLVKLEEALGQAWFDGARSIVDPRYNDGIDRLPFWILGFWKKMVAIIEKQDLWKRSCCWVEVELQKSKDEELAKKLRDTRSVICDMEWDSQLKYQRGAVTKSHLCSFLSSAWLNDEHIDMMMEHIAQRVNTASQHATKVIVAPLSFAREIENLARQKITSFTHQKTPLLCRYEARIKEGVKKIYFPLNIQQQHWIAGFVDFEARTIGY